MIKRIAARQLKAGMFVHDFNHDWKDPCCQDRDPNAFRGPKLLRTDEEVQAVVEHGIAELYIDTARGRDVEDAPTAAEVQAMLEAQLRDLAVDDGEDGLEQEVPMEREIHQAAKVKAHARTLVGSILEDARLGKQVTLSPVKDAVRNMADSMFRNPDALLSLSLIKQRDEYTFMHSVNVGVMLMSFCRMLGMEEEEIINVGIGGMLHDIGKMRTPEGILNKEGKLSDEEFAIMKRHVTYSRKILSETPGIAEVSMHVAAQHHERFDGSGYPMGLKGEEINRFGQMAAIVDVYDAITSDRCYHKGNPPHLALKRMLEWSRYHFSAELYQKFVQCVGIYPMGTLVRLENGLLGVVSRPNHDSLLHPLVVVVINGKTGQRVQPREVDLMAYKNDSKAGYVIKGHEDHIKWQINPLEFLPNAKLYE
ncbi:MAG: HD-GYP domain-containing protein [Magnetococcales bacterium]|nr:HD-GYP domain-containing protein [Magnetococcales bacterium]